MKAKTEARRQTIMNIAEQVFSELGFERASMDEVSKRGGGSKATIYNYFANKEELFFEVMYRSKEAEFEAVHAALAGSDGGNLVQVLEDFGRRLLGLLYAPHVRAVRRLVVAEGGRSGLGARCYQLGPQRSLTIIADFLTRAMEQGKLRRADSHVAAQQLKALLDAELMERFLCHELDEVSEEEIAAVVGRAIPVFMAAYGPKGA
ncbi:TetR/AcrR family transcriptional regulator [Oxalobacteraceae bacterium A2-2]